MFEDNERYECFDRIVRIGSHREDNRLFDRINEHYIGDDHRDSIFRKHLGRCMLTLDNRADYIKIWDLRIKTRAEKAKNMDKIDRNLEMSYEDRITAEIRGRFSFAIIPNLTEKSNRERLEAGLIATFANIKKKQISAKWIGNYHPNDRIKNSGLWNIQHLNAKPLRGTEVDYVTKLIGE